MFWKSKAVKHLPLVDEAETQKAQMAEAYRSVIERTQATIQFKPDGTILTANQNFLSAIGYSLDEIEGKHHRMFMPPQQINSPEYQKFWDDLASGKSFTSQFERVSKSGQSIWIQATYAPYMDAEGRVIKIIKIATDITERQKGIFAIKEALAQLSQGNLSHRVGYCASVDMAELAKAFDNSMDNLLETLSTASEISRSLAQAAEELTSATSELSQRTENQAAALAETATALGGLTTTLKGTASVAKNMEEAADTTARTAEAGGKVVGDAIDAMSNIETSSNRIGQIISVINDIAFQTNLLALNAGVEAARAGDAGRGFAVVASEVRALAQRSAEAANEIKTLIAESSRHVTTGVDLVGEAGKELQKIITGVAQIHAGISEIARGTSEQAISLGEINAGIAQLDAVTQRNAAMVEESTANSTVLAKGARDLARHVAGFQLSGHSARTSNTQRHGLRLAG